MNRGYEALVESWCTEARQHVDAARRSHNLREIVRLIATASTLERAARRLSSDPNVNLHEVMEIVSAVRPCADSRPDLPQPPPQPNTTLESDSMMGVHGLAAGSGPLVVLRQVDVNRMGSGNIVHNTMATDLFRLQQGGKL